MRVYQLPWRHRAAIATLALAIPLAALQAAITSRGPWWKLPYGRMRWAALSAVIALAGPTILLIRGSWIGWYALTGLATLWCALSFLLTVKLGIPAHGFFSLGLALYWISSLTWMKAEMGRPFLDPQIRWFEGRPRPIPGLSAQVGASLYRVSRIDSAGAFLFTDGSKEKLESSGEFVFNYGGTSVKCRAHRVRSLGRGSGLGIRFDGLSADEEKDLNDFVEMLRGHGHGSA